MISSRTANATDRHFIGVDVGTGSARAALVSARGTIVRTHVRAIRTWNPLPEHYEQSSEDVWRAVCECVKAVTADLPTHQIAGIGFDATCSLVALDATLQPCSLSTTGQPEQNIILWMDHRAVAQTARINAAAHPILRFVGGAVSLEMQAPKLLWCKENLPQSFAAAGWLFDLPDYLTWRCTAETTRSLCSTVCKWNFDAAAHRWPLDYFEQIGLGELMANGGDRIGAEVVAPGTPLSGGLSARAAAELGLREGTAVGASMIDAHAGALALFGCKASGVEAGGIESKMAIICGTSSCHMSVTAEPIIAPGVWGPYQGALFDNSYLHEAGQSATGLLLDHICQIHPAFDELKRRAGDQHPHVYLNEHLQRMTRANDNLRSVHELTRDLHVWPDYHGNRSPLADAKMRGMICGLTMCNDLDNLAVIYLAFTQAIAYGTRHILDTLKAHGRQSFGTLIIGGGLSKNALFVQTHADVCHLPVLLARESEMVLLGAAMLGACAASEYQTLEQASQTMAGEADLVKPNVLVASYHDRKYRVFLRMCDDQRAYKELMKND